MSSGQNLPSLDVSIILCSSKWDILKQTPAPEKAPVEDCQCVDLDSSHLFAVLIYIIV